jgi:hypothetical protein
VSKTFLVTFDGPVGIRGDLTKFLDTREEIVDWHSSMANSLIVVTNLDVVALRDMLKSGPARRFLVVEIQPEGFDQTVSGWLPRATWEFINRSQPAKS